MSKILYFVQGNYGRFINKSRDIKITIGYDINKEGYYIGDAVEKENCWIFYGKPYIPSEDQVPSSVQFNPNYIRSFIIQSSISYFLVKHKESGAYFAICRYRLGGASTQKYFSDLLTFIDNKWKMIEWPFEADFWQSMDRMKNYWTKYGNYYEEDFKIIRELNGP